MIQESQGCTTPVFGRTKYFLGEVVLTYERENEEKKHGNQMQGEGSKRILGKIKLKEWYLESNMVLCVVEDLKIAKRLLLQLNWLHENQESN